jgi:hypothetical protein
MRTFGITILIFRTDPGVLHAQAKTLSIDQDNGGWNIHQLTFA